MVSYSLAKITLLLNTVDLFTIRRNSFGVIFTPDPGWMNCLSFNDFTNNSFIKLVMITFWREAGNFYEYNDLPSTGEIFAEFKFASWVANHRIEFCVT